MLVLIERELLKSFQRLTLFGNCGGSNVGLWKFESPPHMKTTRKKSQPLRRFSWSGNKIKTAGQKLVENTINEWYEAKHRKQCIDEIEFINSQKIDICPFCGSKKFYKCGKTSTGIQRFKCHTCSRRFNVLTGTIFDSKKIPISEWIEYLLHLFEFHSIKSSSFDNRNAETTGKFWLQKVFLC